jgi:hypothetical protein
LPCWAQKYSQLEAFCEALRKSRDGAAKDAELLKEQLQQASENIRAGYQLRQSHTETLNTLEQLRKELRDLSAEYARYKEHATDQLDAANKVRGGSRR